MNNDWQSDRIVVSYNSNLKLFYIISHWLDKQFEMAHNKKYESITTIMRKNNIKYAFDGSCFILDKSLLSLIVLQSHYE